MLLKGHKVEQYYSSNSFEHRAFALQKELTCKDCGKVFRGDFSRV